MLVTLFIFMILLPFVYCISNLTAFSFVFQVVMNKLYYIYYIFDIYNCFI